jgi:hypothetical protein
LLRGRKSATFATISGTNRASVNIFQPGVALLA